MKVLSVSALSATALAGLALAALTATIATPVHAAGSSPGCFSSWIGSTDMTNLKSAEPTLPQLLDAQRVMHTLPSGSEFNPTLTDGADAREDAVERYGAHRIVKERDTGVLWHVESTALAKGMQGSVSRAWKLADSIRALQIADPAQRDEAWQARSKFVLKEVDINASERHARKPYSVEIDVLRALGRLPDSGTTAVARPTGPYRMPATPCTARSTQWGKRCEPGSAALYFQEFVTGTRADGRAHHLRPDALKKIRHRTVEQLRQLHALGYLHRDTHPGNILVKQTVDANGDEDFEVSLIDFGHAVYLGDMSPEQRSWATRAEIAKAKLTFSTVMLLSFPFIVYRDYHQQAVLRGSAAAVKSFCFH